ncbi:MAG: hypothetical protein ACOYCA_00195 [Eggerthellaceae bacterium]|jgi:hypothetical protein
MATEHDEKSFDQEENSSSENKREEASKPFQTIDYIYDSTIYSKYFGVRNKRTAGGGCLGILIQVIGAGALAYIARLARDSGDPMGFMLDPLIILLTIAFIVVFVLGVKFTFGGKKPKLNQENMEAYLRNHGAEETKEHGLAFHAIVEVSDEGLLFRYGAPHGRKRDMKSVFQPWIAFDSYSYSNGLLTMMGNTHANETSFILLGVYNNDPVRKNEPEPEPEPEVYVEDVVIPEEPINAEDLNDLMAFINAKSKQASKERNRKKKERR